MIRKTLRNIVKPRFFGRRRYQAFWEKMHSWSLEGMNIGYWESIIDPGEIWVLSSISSYFREHRQQISGSVNSKPLVIFDVGANEGLYSLEVLRFFEEDAKLYSFEPSRPTYQRLTKALAEFTNVECVNAGLSDREQFATLYSVSEDPCLSSIYNRFRFSEVETRVMPATRTEKITLTTIDAFCRERNIEKINFLKIDVEGHELEVLLGAKTLIDNRAIDLIQFEFGGTDVDSKTFLHDFFQLLHPKFLLFRIVRDGVVSLDYYNEKLEIFLYSNFLAVSRDLNLPHIIKSAGSVARLRN